MTALSALCAGWQAVRREVSYQNYWKRFAVVPARCAALKKRVFALRYEVYCVENGFLEIESAEDGLETDRFDENALHFLLIHRETGRDIGSARLVFPDPARVLTSFELQRVCDDPLLRLESRMMRLAELSRFCMVPDFRRRAADGYLLPACHVPDGAHDEGAGGRVGAGFGRLAFLRRRVPYAPLGLLAAAFAAAREGGAEACLTALEPRQIPSLRMTGLEIRTLGPPVRLHGLQQPCLIALPKAAGIVSETAGVMPETFGELPETPGVMLPPFSS